MIDIHNHLLPCFDDGAKSLDEALELLSDAYNEGIDSIILTPHYIEDGAYHESYMETQLAFETFTKQVKDNGIKTRLYLGNEIYIDANTDEKLTNGIVHTLADSDYVLIELPWQKYKDEIDEWLYNIQIAGYKIIIAHPERYEYVKDDFTFCMRWLKEGYLLQVNQNSLFNKNVSKNVHKMLENNFIQFISSDAHNTNRSATLMDAYKEIKKLYGRNKADDLFVNNQIKLINNQNITINYKQPKKKLFGIF